MMEQPEQMSGSSKAHMMRFHTYHGANIILGADNVVAYRKSSFGDAVVFSEKPIRPGEVFLVEIEKNERGWSGHMRFGLTVLSPQNVLEAIYQATGGEGVLPQYALPDLANIGKCWIHPISKIDVHNPNPQATERTAVIERPSFTKEFFETSTHMVTPYGMIPKHVLRPIMPDGYTDILMTDKGSRIGLIYVASADNPSLADMFYIINGIVRGPCIERIPLEKSPLYAVVDVYGTTKQVRIIQLYGIPSLQGACRDVILGNVEQRNIEKLPLPEPMKLYLFEGVTT